MMSVIWDFATAKNQTISRSRNRGELAERNWQIPVFALRGSDAVRPSAQQPSRKCSQRPPVASKMRDLYREPSYCLLHRSGIGVQLLSEPTVAFTLASFRQKLWPSLVNATLARIRGHRWFKSFDSAQMKVIGR